MSLILRPMPPVPDETARIALAVFRKGNPYLRLRDELGPLFTDADFLPVYGHAGAPAISPAQLALVTLLQYAEHLTDVQAADAVRSRLDWKYLLGMPLDDPGFDASVLSDFRTRLLATSQEALLFDRVLAALQTAGLVRARGRQRTDATHVLAAVSRLNRLELVGETMRAALNALASIDPVWFREHADAAWIDRYGPRLPQRRLPRKESERAALLQAIGQDGWTLLAHIDQPGTPPSVQTCAAVAVLRTVWAQQYQPNDPGGTPRPVEDLPPARERISSPYDAEARTGQKRDTVWTGYKVHLSESCDADLPRIITGVETTDATVPDGTMTPVIQQDLARHDLLPDEHLVDTGYVSAITRVESAQDHGIRVIAPVHPDSSWQARAGAGYAQEDFVIDFAQQRATCPEGKASSTWRPLVVRGDQEIIQIHFRVADCGACPAKAQCTHTDRRSLTIPTQAVYDAQQQARAAQDAPAFRQTYALRAGIEGTISQGVRRCDLRHARYHGLAKTRLEHLVTAAALNLVRTLDWLAGATPATTREPCFVRVLAGAA